jgi:hypothetical protein
VNFYICKPVLDTQDNLPEFNPHCKNVVRSSHLNLGARKLKLIQVKNLPTIATIGTR